MLFFPYFYSVNAVLQYDYLSTNYLSYTIPILFQHTRKKLELHWTEKIKTKSALDKDHLLLFFSPWIWSLSA